jgi:hypothetical protein
MRFVFVIFFVVIAERQAGPRAGAKGEKVSV